MKFIKYFITAIIILSCTTSFCAQKDRDAEAIKFLKNFYTIYNTAWSSPLDPKALADSLLTLRINYCSLDFEIELSSDLDHDVLINDQYTDVKHLNTLTVKKYPPVKNTYIVSYIAPTRSPTNQPVEKKVVIYVTVMYGARGIKIARTCIP